MGKRIHDDEPKGSNKLRPLPRKQARTRPHETIVYKEYTIRYRKQDREMDTYSVTLSAPSPEEECPLTLDKIKDSNLDFLPYVPFMLSHQHFKKMTLPCGHSFSAMAIFYHMCRNNLLCPCCRQGVVGKVCSESIPMHFRPEMLERVTTLTTQQQVEDEQGALAQILEIEGYVGNFDNIANQGNLSMVLQFTSLPLTGTAVFVFNVMLLPIQEELAGGFRTVFRPVPSQQRLLTHVRGLSDMVEISIQMRIPQLGVTQMETTGRMSIRGETGQRSIRGRSSGVWAGLPSAPDWVSISSFDIGFDSQEGETFISSLGWRPDSPQVRWMMSQP
jgi:hypothetical protein